MGPEDSGGDIDRDDGYDEVWDLADGFDVDFDDPTGTVDQMNDAAVARVGQPHSGFKKHLRKPPVAAGNGLTAGPATTAIAASTGGSATADEPGEATPAATELGNLIWGRTGVGAFDDPGDNTMPVAADPGDPEPMTHWSAHGGQKRDNGPRLVAAIVLVVAASVGVAIALAGQGKRTNRGNLAAEGVLAVPTTPPGTIGVNPSGLPTSGSVPPDPGVGPVGPAGPAGPAGPTGSSSPATAGGGHPTQSPPSKAKPGPPPAPPPRGSHPPPPATTPPGTSPPPTSPPTAPPTTQPPAPTTSTPPTTKKPRPTTTTPPTTTPPTTTPPTTTPPTTTPPTTTPPTTAPPATAPPTT